MATQYFSCSSCNKRYPTHQTLFETLYEFHRLGAGNCAACSTVRELHITLDFQLGDGDSAFKVVSAFLPNKLDSWLGQEEEEVTLYPFLARLERVGDNREFCWMPYWHVTGKEARFGQHAICLDQLQFDSLIAQVQEKARDQTRERELELAPV